MDALTALRSALADRYAVEREIGRGGMATVYLAEDVRHRRRVALKLLSPELGAVLGVERFLAEIQVTAALNHPNLLPLFDSGATPEGLLYYVMPFVEGESLRTRLDRERQLPVDEAVRIARAVADALDYAHGQGVIHRDLKPENILLQHGQPIVADFGIALAVQKAGGARITQTGLSLGTPHYMSPEQATGDRQLDGRTDVYSLGAVLYEMLTGEPPHTGQSVQAVVARLLTDRPRPVAASRPAVPPHVAVAVDRALEKLPADRWATARELAAALEGQHASASFAERAQPTVPIALATVGWRERMRDPLVRALVAACVVLLAAAGWGWLRGAGAHGDADGRPVEFVIDPDSTQAIVLGIPSPLAISPDGRDLVYLGAPPRGQPQLHRRSAERREIQPIPGTIGATRPFFSPDGQWIAFHAAGKLRKAPITGGSAADIAEMQASPEAVWMEDGRILLATWKGIAVVPSSGGVPRSILPADTLRGERIYRSPVPIDGGRTILYVVFQFGGAPTGRLAAVSADGERRAVPDVHMLRLLGLVDRHLVYVRGDGTVLARPFDVGRLVFTGEPFPLAGGVHAKVGFGGADAALSTSGALAFVHYPRTNRLLRRDPDGNVRAFVDEPGDIGTPRLSPSGAQLLTVRTSVTAEGRQRHDLWLYDVAARTPTRLTSDSASWYGEWAVDGRGVFFKGSLTGSDTALGELWYKALDGSAPRRIIADVEFFALHPNGRQLLYTAYDRSGKQAVWMRGITADTTPRRLPMLHESEIGHRISPDGRWIAYSSNSSGTDQVYVRPLLGGGEVQISAEGGYEPRWSRDGRLYFRDGKQFYVASITTSPRLAVPKRDTLFADDETITSWYDTPSYDVTADGSFLITKRLASPRIVVTLGWTTLLRARIAESRR